MAVKNAEEEFQKYRINYVSKQEDIETALDKLKEILELPDIPHRIEAYDISNTGNKGMVAGMVVFEDGIKKTSHYRKYEIKSINEQNDYACMQEVLYRRLKRLKEGDEDASFSERPILY